MHRQKNKITRRWANRQEQRCVIVHRAKPDIPDPFENQIGILIIAPCDTGNRNTGNPCLSDNLTLFIIVPMPTLAPLRIPGYPALHSDNIRHLIPEYPAP